MFSRLSRHDVLLWLFAVFEGAGQPNVARVIVEHGPGFTKEYELDIDLESEK